MVKFTETIEWSNDDGQSFTADRFELLNAAHRFCRWCDSWLQSAEYEESVNGATFTFRFDPESPFPQKEWDEGRFLWHIEQLSDDHWRWWAEVTKI